jgi:hypothetical protein
MPRGPLKETTKRKRVLDKASEWLNSVGVESLDIPEQVVEEPTETVLDKLKEAESCIIYFETKGFKFKEKDCKTCRKTFAYRWSVSHITRCSVECYKIYLESIGLRWDPNRDQAQRWGRSDLPVVVPPAALEILKDQFNDSLEDLPSDTVQ